MARILSIEDDPDLQHILGLSLQKYGYEVHYAFTGKEGYEKVLTLNPDLVVLDLMLPAMNGAEVIGRIKSHKECRDIPIIVMTAFNDNLDIVKDSMKFMGALEYLRKPVNIDELVRLIRRFLAKGAGSDPSPGAPQLRKGAVRADPRFRTVWIDDRLVATLPPKRFELLKALLEAAGEVSREALLRRVWAGKAEANSLDKAIQRLREDLGPIEGRRLQTTLHGYELVG